MPDVLTPQEKAAIASYSGPVYQAKTGESGIDPDEAALSFNRHNKAMQGKLKMRRAENAKIRHFRSLGLDDAEIGEKLGLKMKTVRSRRFRNDIA